MILELIIGATVTLLTVIIGQVLLTLVQNYRCQQFFRLKSPKIPVIPNKSLLSGHLVEIMMATQNWKNIDEHHKTYGKTFGWYYGWKPIVSTIDLDFIKTYTIDEPDNHLDRIKMEFPEKEFEVDSLMYARREQWQRIRKSVAPAFSAHKIKAPNVQTEIEGVNKDFVDSLERRLDEAKSRNENYIILDIDDMCQRYSLSLVFTCFFKQENLVNFNSKKDYYADLSQRGFLEATHPIMVPAIVFPIIQPAIDWVLKNWTAQGELRVMILDYVFKNERQNTEATKQIERAKKESGRLDADNFHMQDGSRFRRNMVDYIIDDYHAGKLTKREYYNTSSFIFYAGNKTSADSLSKLFYHLAIYPEIQTKLRESILKEGTESEYLLWCVNESLRLYPPSLVGAMRTISRDIETEVGVIPAGTGVCPSVYTINRLEEYWGPEPNKFIPERWSNSANFHPMQNLTFGYGKRNCLGKEFAMHEIKGLAVVLLRKYKFEEAPGKKEEIFSYPFFVISTFVNETPIKISRL